jgi:hypothetical protein
MENDTRNLWDDGETVGKISNSFMFLIAGLLLSLVGLLAFAFAAKE